MTLRHIASSGLLAALCAGVIVLAACGGGGDDGGPPDLGKVPTATLPASLPEAVIVGGGVVQPGGVNTYVIREGDTLATVAERLGVSLEDLLAANPGIDPRALHVGDSVRLPADVEAPVATATSAGPTNTPEPVATNTPGPTNTPSSLGQTYTVQSGDIPLTIAEQFGITVEELLAANPDIDPRNLQVGQVLVIPPAATATPEAPAEGG